MADNHRFTTNVGVPLSESQNLSGNWTTSLNKAVLEFSEERRLAALDSYKVLDTEPEKDFDDIAQIAARICGTPIAVVNLIGDRRQFFKAEVGLGVRSTPLDSSFCAKAILENEFLMIPDATKDHRFDCNPLVTGEPHLRFYAGAVLKTSDDLALGTVCVLGYEPQVLNELQQDTLKLLARQVMAQLELRKSLREKSREAEAQRRLSERRLARTKAMERAEEERKILNAELSHRMKNTLSMVLAIAAQTLKDVSERDAVDAFTGRLHALSKAHDVLLRENWSSAEIAEVMLSVLTLHADGTRYDLNGPKVTLGPKAGLSLSLLLHELATNAIKYGSLSNEIGRVSVKWSVDDIEGVPTLSMIWTESGGPEIAEPTRRGFGSRLIRMGIAGSGHVEKLYLPTGFTATFRAPMVMVQDIGS
ncbi:HWE histidine kinase domain-containing protein [Rhizobium sp. PP-F2F-G48]|uniref:sensor histidine kinase n=1 Tax=Rhizobium sp. PP-F2F-G48 TaxID=2135651 RepID=UPI001FDF0D7D|nr:HWE histidine kinase domain-containing protein [Rhizobium sp. PP-F2F-G48]